MFDYFSAASDEEAASAIGLRGGPGVPPARSPRFGIAKVRRGRAPQAAPFDAVPVKDIDPLVQLGTLERLLTGRDYEQIVAGSRAGVVLANRDGGQRLVVTLTDELQAALADARDEELASVAVPWSRTEEFWGRGDPQILASVLRELAGLARRARSRGERMYCWVCV